MMVTRLKPKLLWMLLPIIPLLAAFGFLIWAETPLGPMQEAKSYLQTDNLVIVEHTDWMVFRPAHIETAVGFIFYPGGRVDPRSYAPQAYAIASQGYLVVITPMPLNLAVFAPDKGAEVIAAFPQITRWAVGGHSLGGAMAANFARNNPDLVHGLILWAAYPASSDDLARHSLAVVSISAELDGLSTREKIDASRPLLPPSTNWVVIAGGNHAQFGWYGDQSGDNPAAISRQDQQDQVDLETIRLLQFISSLESK